MNLCSRVREKKLELDYGNYSCGVQIEWIENGNGNRTGDRNRMGIGIGITIGIGWEWE